MFTTLKQNQGSGMKFHNQLFIQQTKFISQLILQLHLTCLILKAMLNVYDESFKILHPIFSTCPYIAKFSSSFNF